jgi:hypothetical protein
MYSPGQLIQGHIYMRITKAVPVKEMIIEVRGEEKVQWI